MAIKRSVYLSDQLLEVIGPIDGTTSLSGRINQIAERYRFVLERTRVAERFSEPEWNLLRDSLNGVWLQPAESIRGLSIGVQDSIALDHLDRKWGVDGTALLAKLRALTVAEEVALVEAVEQWWRKEAPPLTPETIDAAEDYAPPNA